MSEGNKSDYDNQTKSWTFKCPHCELYIQVPENGVNCKIFRHGYFYIKNDRNEIILTNQINPHETKENCEKFKSENKIIGCGKPFKMIWNPDETAYYISECDYI